jgi:hypothetical protein
VIASAFSQKLRMIPNPSELESSASVRSASAFHAAHLCFAMYFDRGALVPTHVTKRRDAFADDGTFRNTS